jgi:hypothetical protein
MTGVPCPGCGLTRAVEALTEGHVVESLKFNPAGLLLVIAALAVVIAWRVQRLDVPAWIIAAAFMLLAVWNMAFNPTFS